MAEGGTCHNMERNRASESHSHPGEGRGRDLSGHRKKSTERGALTSWRRQREGLVKTQKETDRVMHTHQLEMVEGGTCQDTERNRPSEAHSLSGDGKRRSLSGHRKKLAKRGTLTLWRRQREGLVRIQKEINRARHTYKLEMAEGGTCQDMGRNRASKSHSHPRDSRGRKLSRHRKRLTERCALTN